jgi:uncharacterized protein YjbI with pentapeptide repeats
VPEFFANLCHLNSSAGWRPGGPFPSGITAKGIDFSVTELSHLSFRRADLENSSFEGARIDGCVFSHAYLASCSFAVATISNATFCFARLDQAKLDDSRLYSNRFNGASMSGVSLPLGDFNLGLNLFYGDPSKDAAVPIGLNDFSM